MYEDERELLLREEDDLDDDDRRRRRRFRPRLSLLDDRPRCLGSKSGGSLGARSAGG